MGLVIDLVCICIGLTIAVFDGSFSLFSYHFHNGSQSNAEDTPFDQDMVQGFCHFLCFVREYLPNTRK